MQINLYGEARRTEKFSSDSRESQSQRVEGESSERVQGEDVTGTKWIPRHGPVKSIREREGLSSAPRYKPSNRLHRCRCQQSVALRARPGSPAAVVAEGRSWLAAENNIHRALPRGADGERSKSRLSGKEGKHILTTNSGGGKKTWAAKISSRLLSKDHSPSRGEAI